MTVIGMTIYQPTDRYRIDYTSAYRKVQDSGIQLRYVHGYRTVRT